jgi:hypothetical protein
MAPRRLDAYIGSGAPRSCCPPFEPADMTDSRQPPNLARLQRNRGLPGCGFSAFPDAALGDGMILGMRATASRRTQTQRGRTMPNDGGQALYEVAQVYRAVYALRTAYDRQPVLTVSAAVAYGELLLRMGGRSLSGSGVDARAPGQG